MPRLCKYPQPPTIDSNLTDNKKTQEVKNNVLATEILTLHKIYKTTAKKLFMRNNHQMKLKLLKLFRNHSKTYKIS